MRFIASLSALIIFIFNASITPVAAESKTTEPRVYITKTGSFYHSADCHYLRSQIPIGLYQAKRRGYSACSYCNGQPDGYIEILDDLLIPTAPSISTGGSQDDNKSNITAGDSTKNNSRKRNYTLLFLAIVVFVLIIADKIHNQKR